VSLLFFFFSSRRRHTRCYRDWSSDVCSSDLSLALLLADAPLPAGERRARRRSAPAGVARAPARDRWRPCRGRPERPPRPPAPPRSEERRVGKEWRAGGLAGRGNENISKEQPR